jgi:glycosyltransferase involved in cell wall biosynthesis
VWQSAVRAMRGSGHQVRVLATSYRHPGIVDGDEPDVYRVLRWYWRDHDFARFGLAERVRMERNNHAALARHIRELDPEVVSIWSMGGMSHSLIEDVRRRGIPIVAFVHDQWLDYGRFTDQWLRLFYRLHRRLPRIVAEYALGIPTRVDYGQAGRYVFVSDFVRRRALEIHAGLADTAVLPSGINPIFFGEPPEREWSWRLLYVGRLHPDKGIHEALAALTELPLEATLTFAGSWDPRDESALEDRVEELGLTSRVTMLGQLPPRRIAELYQQHDVLLFPVLWDEPWGLVPLEAMASGCPVIATGRGGSGEYLRDGSNCLLVPDAEPSQVAAAISRLAESAELRAQLSSHGLDTARRFTEPIFNAGVEQHLVQKMAPAVARATSQAADVP